MAVLESIQKTRFHYLVISVTAMALSVIADAEVVFDGTVGPGGSLSGNMIIPDSQGTTVGNNLFHSFSTFNINTGESALFTGPVTTANILSRVTGTTATLIDGALRHDMPNASFWFINPNGILFGENASLPTTGAFHASAADYLTLEDGGRYGADTALPENTVLTIGNPLAFGFLDANVGSITVQGSVLQVQGGETLSLVGGDVEITGGQLAALSGTLNIASVKAPGEAVIGNEGIDVSSFERLGDISMTQLGILNVSDEFLDEPGAGSIYIRGGQFVMDGSLIFASTYDSAGGPVDIDLSGNLKMDGRSAIISNSENTGRASDINLDLGGDLVVSGESQIQSVSLDSGDSGDISVVAENLQLTDGSSISAVTFDSGKAGSLGVAVVDTISIDGDSSVDRDSSTRLGSDSYIFGADVAGDAGDITLSAKTLVMNGGAILVDSGFYNDNAAGNVDISVKKLQLSNGALIRSAAYGGGTGGDLLLNASKTVKLSGESLILNNTLQSGDAGDIRISTPELSMEDQSFIVAQTQLDGNSGDIDIQVDRLTLSSSYIQSEARSSTAVISTGDAGNISIVAAESVMLNSEASDPQTRAVISSTTFGSGEGGSVRVKAPLLSIENGSVSSDVLAFNGVPATGTGGDVSVVVDRLILAEGGLITADTGTTGDAGSISVMASNNITITGSSISSTGKQIDSAISSGSTGAGNAGSIEIMSPDISIDFGAISASTGGSGDAGSITLTGVNTLSLTGGGNIQARTLESGAGGDININARVISISGVDPNDDSPSTISVTAVKSGKAGNISVISDQVTLKDGGEIRSNAFGSGDAGSIHIVAKDQLNLKDGAIETTSERSSGGNVTIEAKNLVYLVDSAITAEAQGVTPGNDGGNISIDPTFIILKNSQIIANANAGNGGNITLVADALIVDPDSVIDASSATGIDGEIVIESPNRDISGDIVALNTTILDASQLLRKRCAAAALKDRSSFTVATEGGLSNSPDVYIGGVYGPQSENKRGAGILSGATSYSHSVPLLLTAGSSLGGGNDCYNY